MAAGKIGLALGGGAARGWAHIGVLKALAAAGIKPDVIAGTSIGAVVGGCYAAGHLEALEGFARQLTRRRVFGYLDFNFTGTGLISGQRLCERLDKHLGDRAIEDLDCRFTAVATEIGSGHEVWLSRGRLVDAVRASYALPGVFRPVKINGRWLFDGALVNPIPVTVCRALGASYVIAVNLNFDVCSRGTVVPHFEAQLRARCPRGGADPGQERRRRAPPAAAADLRQGRGRSRHLDRDGRRLQHRPGPHRALAAGRRPRRHDLAAPERNWPVRFPSRRGTDRARAGSGAARVRRHRGAARRGPAAAGCSIAVAAPERHLGHIRCGPATSARATRVSRSPDSPASLRPPSPPRRCGA